LSEVTPAEPAQNIAVITDDSPSGSGHLIQIEKKGSTPMGIGISMLKNVGFAGWTSGGLKVNKISQGLIREWNLSNPSAQVWENDIIVEVNSLSGRSEELLDKIGNESVLELRLLRPDNFESYNFGTQVKSISDWFPLLTLRTKTHEQRQRSIFGID